MGKPTVYGSIGFEAPSVCFHLLHGNKIAHELRFELFFTVIKSFLGVHVHVFAEIFAQSYFPLSAT